MILYGRGKDYQEKLRGLQSLFELDPQWYITHLSINSEHHANPNKVFLNQILGILLALLIVIWEICSLQGLTLTDVLLMVITDMIGNTCVVATIICIESRLDAYRLDREAAGWTEEKGYPEGYVHEWEKK